MEILLAITFGLSYFLVGIILFVANLFLFQKLTPFDVSVEIFETQNKALWSIVKGQLIWQAIMIGMLIYFMGTNFHSSVDLNYILLSLRDIFAFGVFGIVIFQLTLYLLWKFTPLYKEIIVDNNESLWRIIEWFLIAMSLILSVSLYSY